jgi:hypothetical protein
LIVPVVPQVLPSSKLISKLSVAVLKLTAMSATKSDAVTVILDAAEAVPKLVFDRVVPTADNVGNELNDATLAQVSPALKRSTMTLGALAAVP